MVGIDAYIYIIISLLGVAYPLLLQVIARLDEKYDSDNIGNLFDKEPEGNFFPGQTHEITFIWFKKK